MRHPSVHIREHVIPEGLSVIQSAEILGVGRPALSTFLNGKAALSLDMALRLEKSFDANAQELLNMQIEYDKHQVVIGSRDRPPKSYVPPFLQPKAKDIEKWAASGIIPRFRLAVFLRTLIGSTGYGVTLSNFPGDDEAERKGWDGRLNATEATPWIPEGSSCWEFSTTNEPFTKARNDYNLRTEEVDHEERQNTTFVFVTPHGWNNKSREDWLNKCRSLGHWKDVRVYDSNDLVQWLEQSIPAQTWFAKETNSKSLGTSTLEAFWNDWNAQWTKDRIPNLFQSSVDEYKQVISNNLSADVNNPIVISSDSVMEALAYLYCLFTTGSELLSSSYDKVVVFTEKGTLKKVATKYSDFIAVITNPEIEKELDSFRNDIQSILVYPKTARRMKPDVVELRPLRYGTFEKALSEAGYKTGEIEQLSKESGRSLTVLRRRISKLPSVRIPDWAKNVDTESELIPFLFAGTWRTDNSTDRFVMRILSNDKELEHIEEKYRKPGDIFESPVWTTDSAKGLISKIDVLHAVAPFITESHLQRYFKIARIVLTGVDNSNDCDKEGGDLTNLAERVHEISPELRENILDTLVMLAVYCELLIRVDKKPKLETKLSELVKELLGDLTLFKRNPFSDDLRYYAEACPEAFIDIIERDIRHENSVCREQANADSTGVFDNSFMTGLLAALEVLAWSTNHIPYVVDILISLSSTQNSRRVNDSTFGSLNKILNNMLPQTSASAEQRRILLKQVMEKDRNVAWRLCMSILDPYPRVITDNFKPMYRDLGQRLDQPVLKSDVYKVKDYCAECIKNEFVLDQDKINELLSIVQILSGPTHNQIWEAIKKWCGAASTSDRAWVKSKIRKIAFTKAAKKYAATRGLDESHFSSAKELYDKLVVTDVFLQHRWLFENMWIERTLEDERNYSYDQDHEESVKRRRIEAINEIYRKRGLSGIMELLFSSCSAWIVGSVINGSKISQPEMVEFVSNLVRGDHGEGGNSLDSDILNALMKSITDNQTFLYSLLDNLPKSEHLEILLISPFNENTWVKVRELTLTDQTEYWQGVNTLSPKLSVDQLETAVTNLLKVKRPRIALRIIEFDIQNLSSRLLFQILYDLYENDDGNFDTADEDEWIIQRILGLLNQRKDLSEYQLASIELKFIGQLDIDATHPLNIEMLVESEPTYFVQLVAYAYEQDRDEVDFKPESDSHLRISGKRARQILDRLKRVPGHDENGTLNSDRMLRWIKEVRRVSRARFLENFCDRKIGDIYAKAIQSNFSKWPVEPVASVLEEVLSEDMLKGIVSGLYWYSFNKPAKTYGGEHDRKESQWHQKKAESLRFTHPRVAKVHDQVAKLLKETADEEAEWAESGERLRG